MTPSVVTKAITPPPFLSMACETARRMGAAGVLILPEGPMEWDLVWWPVAAMCGCWWPARRNGSSRPSVRPD